MPSLPADPPTCNVLDWIVFGPGIHKDELYSVERCQRVPQNFKRLQGRRVPHGKLGHDTEQSLAFSLGFPSVGNITRCEEVPGYPGTFSIDVRGVPTEVGGEISAGRINSGSVEPEAVAPGPQRPDQAHRRADPRRREFPGF